MLDTTTQALDTLYAVILPVIPVIFYIFAATFVEATFIRCTMRLRPRKMPAFTPHVPMIRIDFRLMISRLIYFHIFYRKATDIFDYKYYRSFTRAASKPRVMPQASFFIFFSIIATYVFSSFATFDARAATRRTSSHTP